MGAIRALREAKLRVPDDVSVVGFDDIQSAAYQNPALTTVRQPLREMGRIAAETLAAPHPAFGIGFPRWRDHGRTQTDDPRNDLPGYGRRPFQIKGLARIPAIRFFSNSRAPSPKHSQSANKIVKAIGAKQFVFGAKRRGVSRPANNALDCEKSPVL